MSDEKNSVVRYLLTLARFLGGSNWRNQTLDLNLFDESGQLLAGTIVVSGRIFKLNVPQIQNDKDRYLSMCEWAQSEIESNHVPNLLQEVPEILKSMDVTFSLPFNSEGWTWMKVTLREGLFEVTIPGHVPCAVFECTANDKWQLAIQQLHNFIHRTSDQRSSLPSI